MTTTNETRADLGFAAVEGAARRTGVWDGLPAVTAIEDTLSFVAHACDRVGIDPVETFCDGLKTYREDLESNPRVIELSNGDQHSMAAIVATHDPVGDVIAVIEGEHERNGETEAV